MDRRTGRARPYFCKQSKAPPQGATRLELRVSIHVEHFVITISTQDVAVLSPSYCTPVVTHCWPLSPPAVCAWSVWRLSIRRDRHLRTSHHIHQLSTRRTTSWSPRRAREQNARRLGFWPNPRQRVRCPRCGQAPLPASPPGYELIRELGIGGMGGVYLAKEIVSERKVALKFLQRPGHQGAFDRFGVEVRSLGAVGSSEYHPVLLLRLPAFHSVLHQ